jgi:hypothetical protein
MTVRTLNYTRRRRLRHEDLRFSIYTTPLAEHAFKAELEIGKYELPADARIFVEAYRQTHWMRFDFGTVGRLEKPRDTVLSIFDNTDGILFRVRVTAMNGAQGLLLAEGDRIPFTALEQKQKKRVPLLPVVPEDLGSEIYRISYEGSGPELLVNSLLGNWRGIARDPLVIALVYPLVLRDILYRISFVEDEFDREDRGDWRSRWCRFAELLPGMETFPDGRDDREDWVERAVSAFSRRNGVVAKFGLYWKEGAQQ